MEFHWLPKEKSENNNTVDDYLGAPKVASKTEVVTTSSDLLSYLYLLAPTKVEL